MSRKRLDSSLGLEQEWDITFFLVTCAHGIDDMPSDSVWVRRNISEVGRQCDEVRKDMWVRHPTEDVAAVSIAKPDSMESNMVNFQVFLHPEGTITRHNCRQNHIREGTDILMMGYPTGANYVGRYDYAVTRYGVVATNRRMGQWRSQGFPR